MSIEKIRKNIDDIDDEILSLFLRRMKEAQKIGKIKSKTALTIKDSKREENILKRLNEKTEDALKPYVAALYEEIFALSRQYQGIQYKGEKASFTYGLVGESIKKSYSPQIHRLLGNDKYALMELKKEDIRPFMESKEYKGLNITMPYKIEALSFCDSVTPLAREIGCVNTLIKKDDGSIIGANTDYYGFLYMANKAGISFNKKNVLILGSGATAKTCAKAAEAEGAGKISFVSRKGSLNYSNTEREKDTQIIINATPVGSSISDLPLVDLSCFPKAEGVLDVVYNPFNTRLILEARKRNIPSSGGLLMLIAQAKRSHELFFKISKEEKIIESIQRKIVGKYENIVLIGMPGSGKTSLGKLLAKKLNKSFFDTDALIEKKEGKGADKILRAKGEKYFRSCEAAIIKNLADKKGCVIATGGGSVLNQESMCLLGQNSLVIFIKRDLESLSVQGRPLSAGKAALKKLYKERSPLYEKYCDISFENNSSVKEGIKKLTEAYYEIIGN